MNHHMETGHTFTEKSLGTTTIFTIDPQNIQIYYSTNCKDYGVHRLRKRAFYPLLGDSVLSTDRIGNTSGLDSTYVYKIQRGNFPSFEIRFQEFLKHILRNGTTVNLSPLLDDLVSWPPAYIVPPIRNWSFNPATTVFGHIHWVYFWRIRQRFRWIFWRSFWVS